ncbi:MAG: hypothetical protein QXR19_16340 [Candidatus Jordarchaeaceae archaeon]
MKSESGNLPCQYSLIDHCVGLSVLPKLRQTSAEKCLRDEPEMDIILENLKNLIAEIDSGVTKGIEEKIESCWRELWEKKQDNQLSQESIRENQKLLTEIIIAVEAFLSEQLKIDELRQRIKRILKMMNMTLGNHINRLD